MILLATVILSSLSFAEIAVSWPGLSYTATGIETGLVSQSQETNIYKIFSLEEEGFYEDFSSLSKVFWFRGEGELSVNIPYSLRVKCSGVSYAKARASLFLGPGTIDQDIAEISCLKSEEEENKELSLEGVLSVSKQATSFNQLTSIQVITRAEGYAVVPEVKTWMLICIGLMFLWFLGGKSDLPRLQISSNSTDTFYSDNNK